MNSVELAIAIQAKIREIREKRIWERAFEIAKELFNYYKIAPNE